MEKEECCFKNKANEKVFVKVEVVNSGNQNSQQKVNTS